MRALIAGLLLITLTGCSAFQQQEYCQPENYSKNVSSDATLKEKCGDFFWKEMSQL